jgi:hypothetical protein
MKCYTIGHVPRSTAQSTPPCCCMVRVSLQDAGTPPVQRKRIISTGAAVQQTCHPAILLAHDVAAPAGLNGCGCCVALCQHQPPVTLQTGRQYWSVKWTLCRCCVNEPSTARAVWQLVPLTG